MLFINEKSVYGYIYNYKNVSFEQEASLSVEEETLLFLHAQEACIHDLYVVEEKTSGVIRDIIRTHRMLVDDPRVIEETVLLIKKGNSRGYSYSLVIDTYIKHLQNNKDPYMASRSDDLIDIKYKMIQKMYENSIVEDFNKETIVCVNVLLPSMVMNASSYVKGFISREGSYLSHAAILAKEMGLSYIITDQVFLDDDFVVIDAINKQIFINPKEEEIKQFEARNIQTSTQKNEYNLGGFRVFLNVSSTQKINLKKHLPYIEGIGLFRTEHLVLKKETYPSFTEQVSIYKKALKSVYPKKVRIRLFDFSGDKTPYFLQKEHIKEFEYCGPLHKMYHDQLKAILFAYEAYQNAEIMIPMIRDVKEYHHVIEAIDLIMKKNGFINPIPRVGIMLETLDAFEDLSTFKKVDFINVGSNDLSRELIGMARDKVSDYNKYAEAMIEPLKTISKFCKRHNIDYVLCGDLSGRRESLERLIKAQEKSFSIPEPFLKEALEIITLYNKEKK